MFIYRLFWKSKDNPRRIKMDEIKRALPTPLGVLHPQAAQALRGLHAHGRGLELVGHQAGVQTAHQGGIQGNGEQTILL